MKTTTQRCTDLNDATLCLLNLEEKFKGKDISDPVTLSERTKLVRQTYLTTLTILFEAREHCEGLTNQEDKLLFNKFCNELEQQQELFRELLSELTIK